MGLGANGHPQQGRSKRLDDWCTLISRTLQPEQKTLQRSRAFVFIAGLADYGSIPRVGKPEAFASRPNVFPRREAFANHRLVAIRARLPDRVGESSAGHSWGRRNPGRAAGYAPVKIRQTRIIPMKRARAARLMASRTNAAMTFTARGSPGARLQCCADTLLDHPGRKSWERLPGKSENPPPAVPSSA